MDDNYFLNTYGFQPPVGFDTREKQLKDAGVNTEECHMYGYGYYNCENPPQPTPSEPKYLAFTANASSSARSVESESGIAEYFKKRLSLFKGNFSSVNLSVHENIPTSVIIGYAEKKPRMNSTAAIIAYSAIRFPVNGFFAGVYL